LVFTWSSLGLYLVVLARGLRGGCLGVGWGLAGGSEGPGPPNPQPTPRKALPNALYTMIQSKPDIYLDRRGSADCDLLCLQEWMMGGGWDV